MIKTTNKQKTQKQKNKFSKGFPPRIFFQLWHSTSKHASARVFVVRTFHLCRSCSAFTFYLSLILPVCTVSSEHDYISSKCKNITNVHTSILTCNIPSFMPPWKLPKKSLKLIKQWTFYIYIYNSCFWCSATTNKPFAPNTQQQEIQFRSVS